MGTISKSSAKSNRGPKTGTKTPGSKKRIPGESPKTGSRVEPSKVTDKQQLIREAKSTRIKK